MWHSKKFKFGITNQGDAGLDFDWVKHLKNVIGAVIISKAASDELADALLENKSKVIYHATCTGFGGTKLEPNVPIVEEKFTHIKKLVSLGFPVEQIVVRIDPLFPKAWVKDIDDALNINYMLKLKNILMMTEALGIKRVRYSYLNAYDGVLAMLQQVSDKFAVLQPWVPNFKEEIKLPLLNKSLKYESCCEHYTPRFHQVGCISDEDLKILKLDFNYKCDHSSSDDNWCRCASNKLELLPRHPVSCDFDCKYCYWKRVKIDLSTDTKIYGEFDERRQS